MLRCDTVIFDLDGTLLDTLDDLTDSVNNVLHDLGWPLRSRDEIRLFLGDGVAKLIQRAVPPGTGPEDTAQALALFKRCYASHMEDQTIPYPGITELLKALRKRGCRLAVVSNKFDLAVKRLSEKYFPGLLDAAAGESPSAPKKPAPSMVLHVMETLGAVHGRTLYVGDSEVDLQTAKNAHLPCASVTWGFREEAFLREHGAELLIHSPAELLAWLEK